MEQELPEFHGYGFFQQDRAKAYVLNSKLRKQLAEFRAPHVMMYVREKILNGDLEKTIKMWERKVEIAEVSPLPPGGIGSDLADYGVTKFLRLSALSSEPCSSGMSLYECWTRCLSEESRQLFQLLSQNEQWISFHISEYNGSYEDE